MADGQGSDQLARSGAEPHQTERSAADARAPVFALVVGNVVGFSGTSAAPLWLGTFQDYGAVRSWVASSEILLVGVGSLVATAFLSRWGARRTCAVGALLAAFANLLSMVPDVWAFAVGRCLAGFVLGSVLASVNALAAARPDAQKAFASMFLGQAAFAAIFYLLVPQFIALSGERAVFGVLALTALAGAALMAGYYPNDAAAGAKASFRPVPRAVIILLALAALFVGQSMAWISLFTIARMNGLDAGLTSRIMALASVAMMAGPLIARLIGTRFGLLMPLAAYSLLLSVDVTIISFVHDPVLFTLATAGLVLLPAFGLPYAATLVGQVGGAQHASAMPAVITFGSAIGPALAAPLLQQPGPAFAVAAALICVTGTLSLFAPAYRANET